MPDYKEMYYTLFRAHAKICAILQQAGKETEEMYLANKEPVAFAELQKCDKLDKLD